MDNRDDGVSGTAGNEHDNAADRSRAAEGSAAGKSAAGSNTAGSSADERGARVEAADKPEEARGTGGAAPAPEHHPAPAPDPLAADSSAPDPSTSAPSAPVQPPPPPAPRVLCDTRAASADPPPRPGVLWKLAEPGRQLDANLVHLPPGSSVAAHAEPDLDVALLVVAGSGTLGTDAGGADQPLTVGALAWLPRGSTRSLSAGPQGLSYVTVHRARPGLGVRPRPEGWRVMGG